MDIASSITGSISIPLVGHRLKNAPEAVRTILTMVAQDTRDHGNAPSNFLNALEREGAAIVAQVWGEGARSETEEGSR